MPAPPIFIYSNSNPPIKVLNPKFKKWVQMVAQSTEASKFLKGYIGGYPNPLGPDNPWGPIGPWVRSEPEPQTNFPNFIMGELLLDAVANANAKDHQFSVFAAIKKEKLIQEALSELHGEMKYAMESISKRIDKYK